MNFKIPSFDNKFQLVPTTIYQLVKKDFISEFRMKSAIHGVLLYVVSTIYISYLIFNRLEDIASWIGIFWIILIFGATNASINTFKNESGRQFIYYYSLVSPQSIIISKLLFNSSIVLIVSILNFLVFSLLLGNPLENILLFSLVLFLGSLGISSILTLGSAIASKTNNSSTLTAILSFPILLPVLLTSIKASVLCGLGFGWDECSLYLYALLLLNIVVFALSYILFPYLWRS